MLWRHVRGRSKVGFVSLSRLVERRRNTEVAKLDYLHILRKHDVFRLEVLMNNLRLVEECERVNHLLCQRLNDLDVLAE